MKSTKDNAVYIEAVSEQENGYAASGVIDLDAVPADGNYVELNGTKFTFRDDPDVDNDVAIGSDATESVTNLLAEALPDVATYTQNGTEVTITYKTIGTDGNDYTIDCDYVGGLINTLSGGSDTPDSDWVQANGTTVGFTPKEIVIESDSTSTALKSFTARGLVENDEVILVNSDNSFVDGVLGSVTSESTDIVDSTDPLEDGSLKAKYLLDGDVTAVEGSDATLFGTTSYVDSKFTQGLRVIDDASGMYNSCNTKTVSMWVYKEDQNTDDHNYLFDNRDSGDAYLTWTNGDTFAPANIDVLYVDNIKVATDSDTPSRNAWHHIVFTLTNINDGENVFCCTYTKDGNYDFGGVIDQVEIYDRALTSDEVNVLYNQNRLKYTADISTYDLSDAPVEAFFNDDLDVTITMEDNKARIITKPNKYIIGIHPDTATDGSNIVTLDVVKTGERLVVDGVNALVGDVTDDGGDPAKYTVSLDNHNLTTTPKRAFKLGQELLAKESATTTQFVGTSTYNGLLSTGDVVALDDVEVVISGVSEDVDTGLVGSTDPFGDGSLKAKYLLDGDATDLTGNYNGTATDMTYEAGKFGDAGSFNGSSSYIDTNYTDTTTERTFSMWVYFNGPSDAYSYFVESTSNAASSSGLGIGQDDNGKVYMFWGDGTNTQEIHSSDDLPHGQWVHLCLSIKASDTKGYMNGNVTISSTESIVCDSDSYTYKIGCNVNASDNFTDGLIDQVEIYNRALTSDEVDTLYNQTVRKYTIDFDEQASAPTTCGIPDRSTQLAIASKTYDGTKFTNTYSDLEKQGRAFQRKITAEKEGTVVLEPLQTQMMKDDE